MLLFLHVAGAVLFLGNIVTGAFWKIRAHYGKPNIETIHSTVKNIMLADLAFTVPGILLLVIPGGMMAMQQGYSMTELNWLTLSLLLFAISGILWLTLLLPLQSKMIKLSSECLPLGRLTPAYQKVSRRWDIVGTIATVIPIVTLFIMLTKPDM